MSFSGSHCLVSVPILLVCCRSALMFSEKLVAKITEATFEGALAVTAEDNTFLCEFPVEFFQILVILIWFYFLKSSFLL